MKLKMTLAISLLILTSTVSRAGYINPGDVCWDGTMLPDVSEFGDLDADISWSIPLLDCETRYYLEIFRSAGAFQVPEFTPRQLFAGDLDADISWSIPLLDCETRYYLEIFRSTGVFQVPEFTPRSPRDY